jgi:ADP-ribose pyrophosphatase YjhB (NUDIX family)
MEITRHFTATTFVVFDGRVLLHRHPKLQMLLPPGGHVERDELPEEAALREVREETGLEVELETPEVPDMQDEQARALISPRHILLERINPFHEHIDFIYYARAQSLHVRGNEAEEWRWYTADEVRQLAAPKNVQFCALEALDFFV